MTLWKSCSRQLPPGGRGLEPIPLGRDRGSEREAVPRHPTREVTMGLVVKDDGWRMPEEVWARMEPLLPPRPAHPLGCHNPRVPDRDAMNAILLVLRTGMQWNALDATGICSCSSAYRRFREWAEAGVFLELWRRGLLAYDDRVGIEWAGLAMGRALGKAPLRGESTRPEPTHKAKKGRKRAPSTRARASRSGSRQRART